MRLALLLVGLLGCRPEFELGPSSPRGAAPLADAGIGSTVRVASPITLDGSKSIDPDGTITGYRWILTSAPGDSLASVLDADAPVASLTPDMPGAYVLELEVSDDDGNVDRSVVTHYVIPLALTVNAGTDINVEWRRTVALAGTIDNIEGPEPAALTWRFVSKPARSATVLQNASSLTPTFVADAVGTYVLELSGTTSQHAHSDTVTVVVAAQTITFQGAFIDAVFVSDDEVDRLVAISDAPPRVRFIDPTTGGETSIQLPSTPTAIAMDQYENYVAVATAGQIHVFELFTKTLMGSYPVPFTAANVVFGPFQLVHCFTAQAGPIQTLDLANGSVTATSFSVPAGTVAKLHLNNNTMYAIDGDLTNYRLNVAPVSVARSSPYGGQYALGANLWVRGDWIVVGSGNVFRASHLSAEDLLYRGHLDGDEPATVQFAFSWSPKIITIHSVATGAQPNHQLRLYDSTTLAQYESAPLPDIVVNGVPQASTGRLLAYSWSYMDKILIVASAGSSNAFFVTHP